MNTQLLNERLRLGPFESGSVLADASQHLKLDLAKATADPTQLSLGAQLAAVMGERDMALPAWSMTENVDRGLSGDHSNEERLTTPVVAFVRNQAPAQKAFEPEAAHSIVASSSSELVTQTAEKSERKGLTVLATGILAVAHSIWMPKARAGKHRTGNPGRHRYRPAFS